MPMPVILRGSEWGEQRGVGPNSSRGNPDKLVKKRGKITWTTSGAVLGGGAALKGQVVWEVAIFSAKHTYPQSRGGKQPKIKVGDSASNWNTLFTIRGGLLSKGGAGIQSRRVKDRLKNVGGTSA